MKTGLRVLAASCLIGAGVLTAPFAYAQTVTPATPGVPTPPAPVTAPGTPGTPANVRTDQRDLHQDWQQFNSEDAKLQRKDNELQQDRQTYRQDVTSGNTAAAKAAQEQMYRDKQAIGRDTKVMNHDANEIGTERHDLASDRKADGLPTPQPTAAQKARYEDRTKALQDAHQDYQAERQWQQDRKAYEQDKAEGNTGAAQGERDAMRGERAAINQDTRAMTHQDRAGMHPAGRLQR